MPALQRRQCSRVASQPVGKQLPGAGHPRGAIMQHGVVVMQPWLSSCSGYIRRQPAARSGHSRAARPSGACTWPGTPAATAARPPPHSPPLLHAVQVVAAYLLAALGGNAAPAEADIKKILSSGAQLQCMNGAAVDGAPCAAAVVHQQHGKERRLGTDRSAAPHTCSSSACSAAPQAADRRLLLAALACCLAVGIEADAERVQKLLSELEGKDIQEVTNSYLSCWFALFFVYLAYIALDAACNLPPRGQAPLLSTIRMCRTSRALTLSALNPHSHAHR